MDLSIKECQILFFFTSYCVLTRICKKHIFTQGLSNYCTVAPGTDVQTYTFSQKHLKIHDVNSHR